jgi:hypothetical protein
MASTFSATIEVPAGASFTAGSDLEIYDSVDGVSKRRFTGMIRSMTVNPSFDKPGYYVINLSGADTMINLENKRFSRRLGGYGFSMFVGITSGPSNRPSMGFSIDKTIANGSHQYTSSSPRPFGSQEHTKLTRMPERGKGKTGQREKINPLTPGTAGDGTGSGTTSVHSHENMSQGGPAFGVFTTL